MSQKNVEIVRRVFDAVARRDSAAVLALYDPAVEVDTSRGGFPEVFGRQIHSGYEGLRGLDRELREAFQDFDTICEELIDTGERVVSVNRYRMRGRSSGIELPSPTQAGVWTISEGKVIRVEWYATREEALQATGF